MSKRSHIYNQIWSLVLIFFISFFHLACGTASAQQAGIAWTKDLGGALATAKKSKKLVCVDVFTNW